MEERKRPVARDPILGFSRALNRCPGQILTAIKKIVAGYMTTLIKGIGRDINRMPTTPCVCLLFLPLNMCSVGVEQQQRGESRSLILSLRAFAKGTLHIPSGLAKHQMRRPNVSGEAFDSYYSAMWFSGAPHAGSLWHLLHRTLLI